ncbi:hypothetical protein IVG45_16735 [Methylomonas sp. LL1]|uniref:hypothetical protein n=1 Tax=Methylomonas sp. LL1 TaxID=2785785 RepID=UPI0018C35C65|nr:hypothetical protein [Methylomonas sp. LL1]QPK62484.1 hypothetical protein IVG45_16735 [Methylomonas sp. LL1]
MPTYGAIWLSPITPYAAIGGGAVGYYACGGGVWGRYVLGVMERSPEAVAFFKPWFPWPIDR